METGFKIFNDDDVSEVFISVDNPSVNDPALARKNLHLGSAATQDNPANLNYPQVDGAAGQALITDGEGNIGWGSVYMSSGLFVTSPEISGPTDNLAFDGTVHTFTATECNTIDTAADGNVTLMWGISAGSLNTNEGESVEVTFNKNQQGREIVLYCYGIDSRGNSSEIVNYNMTVASVEAPTGSVISIPSVISVNTENELSVGNTDGHGDDDFKYYWEITTDGGTNWDTEPFDYFDIARPKFVVNYIGLPVQIRCTISNCVGSETVLSDIVTSTLLEIADDESYYEVTDVISFPATEYTTTPIGNNAFRVDELVLNEGDTVNTIYGEDTVRSVYPGNIDVEDLGSTTSELKFRVIDDVDSSKVKVRVTSSTEDKVIDASTATVVDIDGYRVADIACGYNHTILLKENGNVYGWGSNTYKQSNPDSDDDYSSSNDTLLFSDAKQIACGKNFVMVINNDRELHGWGYNGDKQVSPNDSTELFTNKDYVIKNNIVQVSCGASHTMVVDTKGNLYGWGKNDRGQVNGVISSNYAKDTVTPILTNVKKVACGKYFTIVLKNDGSLTGWGDNEKYQTDFNTGDNPCLGTSRSIISNIKDIFCGDYNTFVIDTDDNLKGWGYNSYRQTNPSSSTTYYNDGTSVIKSNVKFVASGSYQTIVIDKDNKLDGWGANSNSQTDPTKTGQYVTTLDDLNITDLHSTACGYNYSLIIKNDGNVYGWGANSNYRLNPDSSSSSYTDQNTSFENVGQNTVIGKEFTLNKTFDNTPTAIEIINGVREFEEVTNKTTSSITVKEIDQKSISDILLVDGNEVVANSIAISTTVDETIFTLSNFSPAITETPTSVVSLTKHPSKTSSYDSFVLNSKEVPNSIFDIETIYETPTVSQEDGEVFTTIIPKITFSRATKFDVTLADNVITCNTNKALFSVGDKVILIGTSEEIISTITSKNSSEVSEGQYKTEFTVDNYSSLPDGTNKVELLPYKVFLSANSGEKEYYEITDWVIEINESTVLYSYDYSGEDLAESDGTNSNIKIISKNTDLINHSATRIETTFKISA